MRGVRKDRSSGLRVSSFLPMIGPSVHEDIRMNFINPVHLPKYTLSFFKIFEPNQV
jgi:hypothetical protein